MGGKNLLKKLKNLARENGEVLLVDEASGDLFCLSVVESDEGDHCCGGNCDCHNEEDFNAEDMDFSFPVNEPQVEPSPDEKELMERVNADIAKWRVEQEKEIAPKNIEVKESSESEEKSSLLEEERYYLEPLE